jgi:hypothetical protein
MEYRPTFFALVFLVLCAGEQITMGQPAESNVTSTVTGRRFPAIRSTNEGAVMDVSAAGNASAAHVQTDLEQTPKTAVFDAEDQQEESRAQRVARVNLNLFIVVASICGFFILCRLWLLWLISQYRKSSARDSSFEG